MGAFATTHWSLVLAARRADDPGVRAAMEDLCAAYWRPLYAYVRRAGHTPEDAADLTQAYFARFLEKDYLGSVRPEAGRFRSFLLASLRHFLANEWDRARAQKRGGHLKALSLDFVAAEAALAGELHDPRTPETDYERHWARTLIERALSRLGKEAAGAEARRRFAAVRGFLTAEDDRESYRTVAASLGMSEGALKTAVSRARRRFGELLRDEVAQTVANADDIDDELRALLRVLA